MQYPTSILLSALAATALARPAAKGCRPGREVNVVLSNQAVELGTTTQFCERPVISAPRTKSPVGSSGPFSSVELNLGDNVQKQDLRCQILNNDGQPIVVVRGANVDITFADGDKGPWTFRDGEQEVSSIVCSGAFVKGEAPPPATTPPVYTPIEAPTSSKLCDAGGIFCIELANSTTTFKKDFAEQGLFREVREVDETGPYTSVTLLLGDDITNKNLRCELRGEQAQPIVVRRGENTVTRFSDGGKGAWTFVQPQLALVKEIICDPVFVADPQ